jgi:hypothetical protein
VPDEVPVESPLDLVPVVDVEVDGPVTEVVVEPIEEVIFVVEDDPPVVEDAADEDEDEELAAFVDANPAL